MITKEKSREVSAAIVAVLKEHGLVLDKSSSKYGTRYEIKILAHAPEIDEAGIDKASPDAIAFLNWPGEYGLNASALGQTIQMQDKSLTFLGVRPSRRRFPLLFVNNATGKQILYTTDVVKYFNEECRTAGARV